MKRLLLMLTLIAAFAPSVLSQSLDRSNHQLSSTLKPISASSVASSQDDPVAKALEQAVNRLAVAEEKLALKDAQLQAKDATIQALEGTVKVRDQQLALALDANKDRATINTGDARVLAACENQLSKADARIYKLEHPGFWNSLFDKRTLTGVGIGFGVGKILK